MDAMMKTFPNLMQEYRKQSLELTPRDKENMS